MEVLTRSFKDINGAAVRVQRRVAQNDKPKH